MSTATRPPRRGGFTLVEVLVALVIVAFGMGAVLTALTSAADNVTRMREKTFAEWVGFNQLSIARLQATLPSTGVTDGDIDLGTGHWHWQQTVENIDVPGIKRLTIRVRAIPPGATGPGASKPSDDNAAWAATVIGFRGDALQSPLDSLANWDGQGMTSGEPSPAGPGN